MSTITGVALAQSAVAWNETAWQGTIELRFRLSAGLAGILATCVCASGGEAQAQDLGRDIVVNGVLPATDGTYRTDVIEVGPLGQRPLLDTPYSISVVPVNLAENQQLQNVRELFRYIPSVQGENIRPQSRGLQAGVVQNTRIDGLNIAATTDYAIEQFERIEVLNGLAGALYGPASPAGTFNYVFKRPTAGPLSALKFGYTSAGNILAHVDISRRVGPNGLFGARINLLDQDGRSYADVSNLRRKLASLSLDAAPGAGTRVELNGSYYRYGSTGFPGTFALASGVAFPSAKELDPRPAGYGYHWAGDDNTTRLASGRLFQDFGSDWQLQGGLLYMTSDRASTVPTLTLTNRLEAYRAATVTTTFSLDRVLSNQATLRGRLNLGEMSNDLFVGTTGFSWRRYTPFQTGAIVLGLGNIRSPIAFERPTLPDFRNRFHAQTTTQQSITLGDTLSITDYLQVLAAASHSWIKARTINRTGAVTARYDRSGFSPTVSILGKPRNNLSVYLTYANSLQQGDNAPSGTVNAGEALSPVHSKEWEGGLKLNVAKIKFSLAAYEIRRPYAFTDATTSEYQLRGNQRNRGVEFTANGQLTENLNLFGGASYLDARLFDTGNAASSDKQILGLPRLTLNVLAEYRLPAWHAMIVTADFSHASQRAGNFANTDTVAGYNTVDLGLRYLAELADGQKIAIRLSVLNAFDERYWANISPSGQNGYGGIGGSADNGTGTLGASRTLRLQTQVAL